VTGWPKFGRRPPLGWTGDTSKFRPRQRFGHLFLVGMVRVPSRRAPCGRQEDGKQMIFSWGIVSTHTEEIFESGIEVVDHHDQDSDADLWQVTQIGLAAQQILMNSENDWASFYGI